MPELRGSCHYQGMTKLGCPGKESVFPRTLWTFFVLQFSCSLWPELFAWWFLGILYPACLLYCRLLSCGYSAFVYMCCPALALSTLIPCKGFCKQTLELGWQPVSPAILLPLSPVTQGLQVHMWPCLPAFYMGAGVWTLILMFVQQVLLHIQPSLKPFVSFNAPKWNYRCSR